MIDDAEATRLLHRHVEPVAQVGFDAYDLRRSTVTISPMEWYYGGRVACLGAVRGEVAAALLGVLEPQSVIAGITATWRATDPATLIADRADAVERLLSVRAPSSSDVAATTALLERASEGLQAAGHALFAGWRAHGSTGRPLADLWLTCVALREHRGAAHIAAWRSAGMSPVEILVLTEARDGERIGSHSSQRMGWSDGEVRAAEGSLTDAGLLADGAITERGRAARQAIEQATDVQEIGAVRALGGDLQRLCDQLAALRPVSR